MKASQIQPLKEIRGMFDEWFEERMGRSADLNYPQDARLWVAFKEGAKAEKRRGELSN